MKLKSDSNRMYSHQNTKYGYITNRECKELKIKINLKTSTDVEVSHNMKYNVIAC